MHGAGHRQFSGPGLAAAATVVHHSRVASIMARGTAANCGAVIAISMRPGRLLYSSSISERDSNSAQRLAEGSLSLSRMSIERTAGTAAVSRSTDDSDWRVAADNE